ncbi:MAG: hypothetical protein H0W25_03275 [Acidimicrobiia bacterium]|nr:hypothetical protein [Acidimicrobiia bacterium]
MPGADALPRPKPKRKLVAPGALVVAGLAIVFGLLAGGRTPLDADRASIPFPMPIYEIEAVSGNHHASILNLPLPYVGAPQVPIPVDINGDLLPDVTASVNLINAEGIFNNPPQPGEVIAPNIEINRLVTAPILTPGGDPLRINVKLTIVDLEGQEPDMVVRYGYDTGPGGSIPPSYKAVLGGLDNFFNPLTARIDTTGGLLIGLDPHTPDLGLSPQTSAYEGPLTTFAQLDTGPALKADVDLRFRPMPDLIEVSFGSADDGDQRFTFAHTGNREPDLDITGAVTMDGLEADIEARIDRLPRQVAVDFGTGADGGGVLYESESQSGRLPDLSAQVELRDPSSPRPLIARLDAESLPETLGAEWFIPETGAPRITFEGSGQGIGALEARIQNYEGAPTAFDPWVPGQRQHVSIQAGPGGALTDDTLIQARLERIRGAEVRGTDDGAIEGTVRIGDGERPLEVHGELDLRPRGLPYIAATATISPLPDTINFAITPTDEADDDPLRIVYEPSESIDVDTSALVGLPDTEGVLACGDAGTVCGEFDLRNVPTRIEARMVNLENESRIEVDAIPRAGAAPLDVFGEVVLGPVTATGTPADGALAEPIRAELAVQGLPRYLRVRTLEDPAQQVQRVDVRTCDLVYATGLCAPGTSDEVAEMTFSARNFELGDRPAGLDAPPQSGPLYLTVGAQGLPDTNELVHWEATGRLTDFRELTYLGTGDLTAARVDIGGNQDFRAFVDVDQVDLNGGDPTDGRVDIDADVLVERLPAPLTFCIAQEGRALTSTPLDPITEPCESDDPFGDGSVDQAPLTIAYVAPGTFSVHTDVAIQGDLPFTQPELPIEFGEIERVAAMVDLTDIPGEFTGYVGTLVGGAGEDGNETSATRVRTVAPGATETVLSLKAEVTTAGVECADPDPVGGAVCASVLVDGLPDYASIIAGTITDPDGTTAGDDAVVAQEASFRACDYDVVAGACVAGTEGSIGVIDVDVRAHAGSPDGIPAYAPPADSPHLYAQADIDSLADFEIEAGIRIEDLQEVSFSQGPDGIDAAVQLGQGQESLTVHGYADLRDMTSVVPEALRAEAVVDVVLDPLPERTTFRQTGPGENQTDPVVIDVDVTEAALLTVDAEVRENGTPDDAECGARGTYCAGLVVDRLPQTFDATITREFGAVASNERDVQTRMVIEQQRFNPADAKADVEVHAAIGLPIEAPVIGDGSVYADLVLTGLPNHLSVGLDNHEVLSGAGPDDYTVDASSLERLQVFTCQRDFAAEACLPGTEDQLDRVELSARSFRLRPTNFPAPLADGAPLYVGVAGRGTNLEAVVDIPEISEIQFLNRDGVTGATARVGGGTPSAPRDLQVRVDVVDLPLADRIELGDLHVLDPTVSLDATVDVSPFPGELAFCLRNGGTSPVPLASNIPFVATCEDADPFGDGVALTHTPLSIGFDANDDFDVDVAAAVTVNGRDEDLAGNPAIPSQRLFGELGLADLPSDLVLHFQQPRERDVTGLSGPTTQPGGPFRGILETPGATSGIDLSFAAGYLIGADTVCEDPRPGRSATCVSFGDETDPGIENLPTTVEFFYDPDVDPYDPDLDIEDPDALENFMLRTDGPAVTQINNLHISSVNPPVDLPVLEIPLLGTLSTEAIVVDVDLDDIPQPFDIRGSLLLTDEAPTAVFEVQNGNTLPGAEVHVRNFLSPDPTAGLAPPNRPVADDPAITTYTIQAFQRGPAVRVDADIFDIRSFGIEPVRSATDRRPLGTTLINTGFATDFNVRAYVDLLPEPGFRILGDVLLGDMPADVSVCVRGPREADRVSHLPVAGTATWCDGVGAGEGALEIDQQPQDADRHMDVDAFARLEYGGGSSVIAGRVDIDEMPQIVRARFGGSSGKDVEIQAFSRFDAGGFPLPVIAPDGIDRIRFEAASFDLTQAATGIVGTLPYSERIRGGGPFPAEPAPADGREYLHAAADLSNGTDSLASIAFHVLGQIGRDDNQPSSQLQSFTYAGRPCPTPLNNPADYPRMPTDDGTGYTCIRVLFDGATDGVNPLSLHAFALLPGGDAVRLHDAGISNIPAWIQLQTAEAEHYTDPANRRGWRRPCGPASTETGPCMAPYLRFDQPDLTHLFGQLEYGKISDLAALDDPNNDPDELAPDFDAVPNALGWDGQFENNEGIRLKLLDFDGGTLTDLADDRFAARASFRLAIPGSIQVDQIQTYSLDLRSKTNTGAATGGSSAEDMRVHLIVRNHLGQVEQEIGELAAFLHFVDSGAQILLTKPCPTDVAAFDATEPRVPCAEYGQGIDLPGEVSFTMYMREHLSDIADGKLRTSQLIQIDGRLSTSMSIGVRLLAGGAEITDGITLGTVEAAIRNLPGANGVTGAHAYDPDFRFRTELISDGDKPTNAAPPASTVETGSVSEENDGPELNEWYEFNMDYSVGIQQALVGFDLDPANSPTPAVKRLDAVIFLNTPALSADIAGYANLAGTQPAEFSFGAAVAVSPLDFHLRSQSNIGANLDILVREFITETIGAPGWLADVIGFIIKPITAAIDAILNTLPIQVRLQSDLDLQFSVDRLNRFTLRSNILHQYMDGEGSGDADFGPINWYVDEFSGGLDFDIPRITIPKWICWVPGIPCSIDPPPILLLGYAYAEGLPIGSLGLPILMDYRDCDAFAGIGSIIPFAGGGGDNAVTLDPGGVDGIVGALVGGDDEDFVMWIGTDPRMSFGGILYRLLDAVFFGGFSTVLDLIVDVVAGPILCNIDAFSIDADKFQGINNSPSTPLADYNPGNPGAIAFAGHPVPGQPGQPESLPPVQPVPTDPIVFPAPVDPGPVTPPVNELPTALAAFYTGGTDRTISTAVALCGVHQFDDLSITSTVTVATTANATDLVGTGAACPAGDEGTLELRANTINVAASGAIVGNGIMNDIPDLTPEIPSGYTGTPNDFANLYRATGSSGGTNAGVGSNGTAPEAAFQDYGGPQDGLNSDAVFTGAPGSSVGGSFTLPDIGTPNPIPSAGAGGLGGGAVILRADSSLVIAGSVSVNGGAGASNTAGVCDADPDDNGTPGLQQHDSDPDPDNVVLVDNDVLDPPYEHSGFIGSGGGAGGGILLEARGQLTLTGTVSAVGGPGGSGRLGQGGGGGGGSIKVAAPSTSGIALGALNTAVVGGADGTAVSLCAAVPAASAQTYDNPQTPAVETGALPHNGVAAIVDPPVAQLRPYGPFWWPGGAGAPTPGTFPAYYVGAGGPGTTTLHVCAVTAPLTSTWDPGFETADDGDPVDDVALPTDQTALASALTQALPRIVNHEADDGFDVLGTLPTAANPCGAPAPSSITGVAITPITVSSTTFSGVVSTPTAVTLNLDTTGYYGLYTTAVRGTQAEVLGPVEWAFGVDADRPTVAVTAPDDTPSAGTVLVPGVNVQFTAADTGGSGLARTECRTVQTDASWRGCTTGQLLELSSPDGLKTVEVRAYDHAGNVSSLSPSGSHDPNANVYLDVNAPEASLQLVGGAQSGGWYRTAPALRFHNYTAASPAGDPPYLYRFDNGAERAPICPVATPTDCTVSATDVAGLLATGDHTVHYTAVNQAGNRKRDDNDLRTPGPMNTAALRYDPEAPMVEVTTVPLAPNQTYLGQQWYDDAVVVVLSTLDQFGGSGVATVQYRFGNAGPYTNYVAASPPVAPQGASTFCHRVVDVAGNEVTGCRDIRVDSLAPASFILAPSAAPDGNAGWYRTAPSFTVTGYGDGVGVGADADHFRTRTDNSDASDCDAPTCTIPAGLETGSHLVHASATDRFDNRSGEQTLVINVDLEAPVIVPVIGPAEPDGEHGWWHTGPFLTLFAVDPGEGSGVATLEYSLNNGSTWTAWTAPVRVGGGQHTLCWRGADVAGNANPGGCRSFFVDLDDPTSALAGPGAAWRTADATVTISAADTAPGSGLGTNPVAVCEDLTPAASAVGISGVCASVDGGPYVPVATAGDSVGLSEGIHLVRSYAIDRSGRRSAVVEHLVRIDQSAPVVEVRLVPPDPAQAKWYRVEPLVVLRADDGHDGSGVTSLEYRIDTGPWTAYTGPITVPEGNRLVNGGKHVVQYRVADVVGSRSGSVDVWVDRTPPTARATTPDRTVFVPLLGQTVKLRYVLGDNLSGRLTATVTIFDVTGNPVRRITAPPVVVAPGTTLTQSVTWNGRDNSLLNILPVGAYYYRVTVVDEAGNVAASGESTRLTLRLL